MSGELLICNTLIFHMWSFNCARWYRRKFPLALTKTGVSHQHAQKEVYNSIKGRERPKSIIWPLFLTNYIFYLSGPVAPGKTLLITLIWIHLEFSYATETELKQTISSSSSSSVYWDISELLWFYFSRCHSASCPRVFTALFILKTDIFLIFIVKCIFLWLLFFFNHLLYLSL